MEGRLEQLLHFVGRRYQTEVSQLQYCIPFRFYQSSLAVAGCHSPPDGFLEMTPSSIF